MKIDIQKTIQYKYIVYRFKKVSMTNDSLQSLSQEDKEKICIDATRKTRKATLMFGILYFFTFSFFWFGWMMNPEHQNNAFVKWYLDTLESVYPLINGDWGSGWYRKKATILVISLKLFPIFIINLLPLLILSLLASNHFLTKRIDAERLQQNNHTGIR